MRKTFMIGILLLLSLLLGALAIGKYHRGIAFWKMLVMDISGFFFLYIIMSAVWFWMDAFAFEPVLICIVTIRGAELLALHFLKKGECCDAHLFTFSWKEAMIPLLIVLLALPFTWNKFELYSMGQDQGTYQIKALQLLSGDTHNRIEMTEFLKLQTPKERQLYLDFIYGQNNLYLPHVIEETVEDASQFTHITGCIHGYQTFAAIMALWGELFGYAAMIEVQTVFYICMIFMAYLLACNLSLSKCARVALPLLSAFSPGVLWGSKSSLTELLLALIFTTFLVNITEKDPIADSERVFPISYLSWIMIAAFAFLHVSIYIFMPILVCVYIVLWFTSKDKGHLFSMALGCICFFLSALWGFMTTSYYTYGNYSVLFKFSKGILNANNIIAVLAFVVILCVAFSVFLASKRGEDFTELVRSLYCRWTWPAMTVRILIRAFLAIALFVFVYKGMLKAESLRHAEYLQISAYIYMTGLFLVPILYAALTLLTKDFLTEVRMAIFSALFLYCVVAYSLFMRFELQYYYYYARYVTIFVPMIIAFFAYWLENRKSERKIWVGAIIFGVAFLSFLPYDKGLRTELDHTRCHWDYLEALCQSITEADALIVGPDEQQILFVFPAKLLKHCDVYPPQEDLRKQVEKLSREYKRVFYLDYSGVMEEMISEDEGWKNGNVTGSEVFAGKNQLSYLDYSNISNPFTPIPLSYVEYELDMSLYAWEAK